MKWHENNSENSWNCDDNEGCIELNDDSGNFSSLSDCEMQCGDDPFLGIVMIMRAVELDNDSGEYSSLNDCEMACENNSENSWNCDDNEASVSN